MFIFIIILVLSGLIMEVGEDILEAIYEDETKVPPPFLFIISFATATHVLSGIFFAVLSVFHICKNWNALKNKSKERTAALICTAAILVLAFLVVCIKEL
jgi:succinate dehydrogenase/fumarate reductase cytochrome b subunit